MFNFGDEVVFKDEKRNDAKIKRYGKGPFTVTAIVKIQGKDFLGLKEMESFARLFMDRFELYKPQEITKGGFAEYVGEGSKKLIEGHSYLVSDVKGDKILVQGSWYNKKNFKPTNKEPEVPDEGEALLKELANRVDNSAGVCSYAVKLNDEVKWHIRDACHARIRVWDGENKDNKPVYVALNFSGHYLRYESEEEKSNYKRYIDWVVNKSFLKDCFIPRDAGKMMENGVLLNTEMPLSSLVCAAIVTRQYTEFRLFAHQFNEIVNMRFDERIALFVAGYFKGSNRIRALDTGHDFLSLIYDPLKHIKTFNSSLVHTGKPYKERLGGEYRVFNTFGRNSQPDKEKFEMFFGKFKSLVKVNERNGWGGEVKTYKIKSLAPFCGELMKFFEGK